MAKGMPSMVALLGLLAVAGYQNRDKLGSVLGGLGGNAGGAPNPVGAGNAGTQGGLEGMLGGLGNLGGLGGMLGGAGAAGGLGGILSGGLGGLMDHFDGAGQGAKAQSWVKDGPNEEIGADDLEKTLGADTIEALQQQTGLSKQELLDRLSKTLPAAVNQLTPQGRLPTESEASRLV